MAEVILKSLQPQWAVQSAGTAPATIVHPLALEALREIGLDGGDTYPKHVDQFLDYPFDYVITVCDNAQETCPVFTGQVREQRHMGFEDPADAIGTREQKLVEFRRIRDEIITGFRDFADEADG
jgi:arsenate reductase